MIERSEYGILVEDIGWCFDILLLDAFDSTDAVGIVLHLGFVNCGECPFAYNLSLICVTSRIS